MGVRERRERHKEALREEILEAARRLFVEEGYESVSMRKIAERIEYSPTTIYLYFRDKADLLQCICEETFDTLVSRHEAILASTDDPVDALARGLRAYVEFGLAHPDHYAVTFMTRHAEAGHARSSGRLSSAGARAFKNLRRMVGKCVAQGRFRPVDVDLASQGLWAAAHGVTALLVAHSDFPCADRDALVSHVIETAIAGLLA